MVQQQFRGGLRCRIHELWRSHFARQTQQQQTEATVAGRKPLIINKSNQQDLDSSTRTQMSNMSTKWVCPHCQKGCKSEHGLEQHTPRKKTCREAERAALLVRRPLPQDPQRAERIETIHKDQEDGTVRNGEYPAKWCRNWRRLGSRSRRRRSRNRRSRRGK